MLEWLMTELKHVEVETKVGAAKGQDSKERKNYFSGCRGAGMDVYLGCSSRKYIGRCEEGVVRRELSEMQGAFYAEHSGQSSSSR